MKKCLNCPNEVSNRAKYCSDKCRKAYTRRTNNPDKAKSDTLTRTTGNVPDDVVAMANFKTDKLLPPDDVIFDGLPKQLRIDENSPTWKNDDYRRLIYHLKTTPIDTLKAEGYYIPCWRYVREAA